MSLPLRRTHLVSIYCINFEEVVREILQQVYGMWLIEIRIACGKMKEFMSLRQLETQNFGVRSQSHAVTIVWT